MAPEPACPLLPYLTPRLPEHVTVSDPCLETLHLLRLIHALSRHYGTLYQMTNSAALITQSVSSELGEGGIGGSRIRQRGA